jgi:hypothetical protein
MHYDQINRDAITDYASIAHGMPEYRMMTNADIDSHVAWARMQQSRITLDMFRLAGRWIAARFGFGKRSAA